MQSHLDLDIPRPIPGFRQQLSGAGRIVAVQLFVAFLPFRVPPFLVGDEAGPVGRSNPPQVDLLVDRLQVNRLDQGLTYLGVDERIVGFVAGRPSIHEVQPAKDDKTLHGGLRGGDRDHPLLLSRPGQLAAQLCRMDFSAHEHRQPRRVVGNPVKLDLRPLGLVPPVVLHCFDQHVLPFDPLHQSIRPRTHDPLVEPCQALLVPVGLADDVQLSPCPREQPLSVDIRTVEMESDRVVVDDFHVGDSIAPHRGHVHLSVGPGNQLVRMLHVTRGHLSVLEMEGHSSLQVEGPLREIVIHRPFPGQPRHGPPGPGIGADQSLEHRLELAEDDPAPGPQPVGLHLGRHEREFEALYLLRGFGGARRPHVGSTQNRANHHCQNDDPLHGIPPQLGIPSRERPHRCATRFVFFRASTAPLP